jgi:protein PET100, fungi type
MYVMFPIGIMYYFGTNLDERFAVPDFWPKPEQANKVPLDKDEIHAELQRLRARRLYLRDRRLEEEARRPPPPPPPSAPADHNEAENNR